MYLPYNLDKLRTGLIPTISKVKERDVESRCRLFRVIDSFCFQSDFLIHRFISITKFLTDLQNHKY